MYTQIYFNKMNITQKHTIAMRIKLQWTGLKLI
jgi:hypothetical protein